MGESPGANAPKTSAKKELGGRPVIIGIVGASGSGKTTLADGIAQILGHEHVTSYCVDDYHRFDRQERAESGVSALDPRSSYMDIMAQDLKTLKQGRSVLKPVYDHAAGTIEASEYIEPNHFVIAYGLLAYTTQALRDCFDVKIFLEPDEDLRVRWKILRDVAKRGYTREEVVAQIEKRSADRYAYVLPQRAFADVVIEFIRGDGAGGRSGELSVRHTLRPTLPHPDFAPLLADVDETADIRRELTRDVDSKPVDILHISSEISDDRALKLESLLWSMLPETFRVHVDAGEYFDGSRRQMSHTLGFTQLLVAYHAVKAAIRVRSA